MAKRGRKKKEILEHGDLDDFNKFQDTIKENVDIIGYENLTDKERNFYNDYVIKDSDSDFAKTVKMYKFKHFILHKPLTQEECTYFVDIDEKGTKASESKRLSKMRICTLEMSALAKLKKAIGSKFNIFKMSDLMISGEDRSMPAKPMCTKEI